LLHKSKDFSINILNIFFKVAKVFIQKVIGSRWACIRKGTLNGRSLKVFEVRDKPNLNNIFKSYLGYCDLKGLHTTPIYLKSL
jgi:hypothetical protein